MDELSFLLQMIVPARYLLAILCSCALAIVHGLNMNFSVVILGMLNHTALRISLDNSSLKSLHQSPDGCLPPAQDEKTVECDGPFEWSPHKQTIILSCYFWGYSVSQFPGGRLAEVYSAKWVICYCVLANAVLALITPPICHLHYFAVGIVRILEGIAGGAACPAIHSLLSKWAPPSEKIVLGAMIYSGTTLGIILSLSSAGGIADMFGWQWVFYISGISTLIWFLLWAVLIKDTPQQQNLMAEFERKLILKDIGNSVNYFLKKPIPVPWQAIISSPAVLAIVVAHTCSNFGWYILIFQVPLYMKHVLKYNMNLNTCAISIPMLSQCFFGLLLARMLGWCCNKNIITFTKARKIATSIAAILPALSYVALSFTGCNHGAALIVMTFAFTGYGGTFSGFLLNHIDLAPNFAGTLMAITNTIATLPGILVPFFANHIIGDNESIAAWRVVFLVAALQHIIGLLIYLYFSTGELQPWNSSQETSNTPETNIT